MPAPAIHIKSISLARLSDEAGRSRCTVTFVAGLGSPGEVVVSWEVRVGGAGPGQGALAERDPGARADSARCDSARVCGTLTTSATVGAKADTARAGSARCATYVTADQTAIIDWNEGLAAGANKVSIYAADQDYRWTGSDASPQDIAGLAAWYDAATVAAAGTGQAVEMLGNMNGGSETAGAPSSVTKPTLLATAAPEAPLALDFGGGRRVETMQRISARTLFIVSRIPVDQAGKAWSIADMRSGIPNSQIDTKTIGSNWTKLYRNGQDRGTPAASDICTGSWQINVLVGSSTATGILTLGAPGPLQASAQGRGDMDADVTVANGMSGDLQGCILGQWPGDPAKTNSQNTRGVGGEWQAGMHYSPVDEYCEVVDVPDGICGPRVFRMYDNGSKTWKAFSGASAVYTAGKWYRTSMYCRIVRDDGGKYGSGYYPYMGTSGNAHQQITWSNAELVGKGWVRKYAIFSPTVTTTAAFYNYGHYGNGIIEYAGALVEEFNTQPSGPPPGLPGFDGKTLEIADVIAYNTVLADADRQAVEAYLGAKWGISL